MSHFSPTLLSDEASSPLTVNDSRHIDWCAISNLLTKDSIKS
jgi:hypothetical protein